MARSIRLFRHKIELIDELKVAKAKKLMVPCEEFGPPVNFRRGVTLTLSRHKILN